MALGSFDGRAALEKMASFYQTAAEDRHVNIACSGEGQIFADPALFNRAVGNLIDNALRFTTDDGNIHVSIATRDGRTEVSVRDTGSGIAPSICRVCSIASIAVMLRAVPLEPDLGSPW